MKCPKCGFSQPDDIYCALCGINIKKYAQKKKTRFYKLGATAIMILLVGLVVTNYFSSTSSPPLESVQNQTETSRPATQKRAVDANLVRNTESRTQSFEAGSAQKPRSDLEQPAFQPAPQERSEYAPPPPQEGEGQLETAKQWFERGRALDDDSENEVECYKTALDIDSEFAPAAFHLGAIYFRKARYELADDYFESFLKHASEQERRTYDIYVYYSLADVERLYDSIAQETAEEETGSGQGQEAQGEGVPGDEESDDTPNNDAGEEILTVVEYETVNGHISVPIVLNGFYTTHLLVDTGAGITIIAEDVARRLQLGDPKGHPITLRTLAMDVNAQRGRLESIQVGDLKKYDFPIAIADPPFGSENHFDGILGMDFMKDYSININNQTKRITLSSRSGTKRP